MTQALVPKSRPECSAIERLQLTLCASVAAFLIAVSLSFGGCKSWRRHPSIEFTKVPPADKGGPDVLDSIEGRVIGALPGQQMVLLAKSGVWWVQPDNNQYLTQIESDSTFKNSTHLGTDYAAILVEPGYHAPTTFDTLPKEGGVVAAVVSIPGVYSSQSLHKTLQFSGYEWTIRAAPSNRGGAKNDYDAANAWTDAGGALHLRIAGAPGKWTCAEVSLTHSLGYGNYRFVVHEVSHLEPAGVFSIFTWDGAEASQNFREVDIETSRWGDPANQNAQFVIQPYFIPANVARFMAPSGILTYSFHWTPGQVNFKAIRGAGSEDRPNIVSEHLFTTGIPTSGGESIHMNLYVFSNEKTPMQNEAEVVVDKFEYLP